MYRIPMRTCNYEVQTKEGATRLTYQGIYLSVLFAPRADVDIKMMRDILALRDKLQAAATEPFVRLTTEQGKLLQRCYEDVRWSFYDTFIVEAYDALNNAELEAVEAASD